MKTLQLRLEPDQQMPMFSRLHWDVIDVSFREVLETGVHPWVGNNMHHDLPDAVCAKLNQAEHKPAGLLSHRLLVDLAINPVNTMGNKTRMEIFLARVQKEVHFCDPSLDFPALSETARATLAERWNRSLALRLAERLNPSFQELRRFLKSKDKRVKLKSQMDLDQYNWGHILSLEDFANHERLLIDEAFGPVNFRTCAFLDAVTDEQQRLRLVRSIDHITLTQPSTVAYRVPVLWQAERHGNHWRLRPNIGSSNEARAAARGFATRWRRDGGQLCFTARTEDLIAMVESEAAQASFPNLRYTRVPHPLKVVGEIGRDRVPVYTLGGIPVLRSNAEHLKAILREYGASTSGVKKALTERIAKVTAEEYARHEERFDRYFTENRFVRVANDVQFGRQLPVLEQENSLKGLLLRVYALRHLRANVVIDPSYCNDSCTVKDLAVALITERVTLKGGFMQVF